MSSRSYLLSEFIDELIQIFSDKTKVYVDTDVTDATNKSITVNQITHDQSQETKDLTLPNFADNNENTNDNTTTETEPNRFTNVFMIKTTNKLNSRKIVSGYINNVVINILPPIINICLSYYCFQLDTLKANDKIDHRDTYGKFCKATIIEKNWKDEHKFLIHYDDWNSTHDIWSDSETEIDKFTQYQSISNRKASRFTVLSVGDFVDVNPSFLQHTGWRRGRINKIDENSGQVRILYSYNKKGNSIWVHLDNDMEIAAKGSKDYVTEDNVSDISSNESDNYGIGGGCDSCGSSNGLRSVSAGTFCWSCRYHHWSGHKEERRRERRFEKAMYEGWADDL